MHRVPAIATSVDAVGDVVIEVVLDDDSGLVVVDAAPAACPTAGEGARSRERRGTSTVTQLVDAETLMPHPAAEDYVLRYAPRSFRKWSPLAIGNAALGGIAYLADFAIGAKIALEHGTTNALWGIFLAAAIIFATGLPLAYYACKYNIDLDLITRGSGFGYYGSVPTNAIYASFTFIFFALEGSMMAQSLEVALHCPLTLGYAIAALVVIPLVIFGMKALAKMQSWTSPLWLVLMGAPLVVLLVREPHSFTVWLDYPGAAAMAAARVKCEAASGALVQPGAPASTSMSCATAGLTDGTAGRSLSLSASLTAMGVCLALITQIAEQIDYLRLMPHRTLANARQWWASMLIAGPGWVAFGAIKQCIGAYLGVYLVTRQLLAPGGGDGSSVTGSTPPVPAASAASADKPVYQFNAVYGLMMPSGLALALATILVNVSQLKINVTNAYSGSLAWTNVAIRTLKKRNLRRSYFVLANVAIALVLMEADMFAYLDRILGCYANVAIAWIGSVASDIAINKLCLASSPRYPEFRRGMIHDYNPVGLVSLGASSSLSAFTFFGGFGAAMTPYSPLVALAIALIVPPMVARATQSRYYTRMTHDGIAMHPLLDDDGFASAVDLPCHVCKFDYPRADVIACQQHDGEYVCSLCLSVDMDRIHYPHDATPSMQAVSSTRRAAGAMD